METYYKAVSETVTDILGTTLDTFLPAIVPTRLVTYKIGETTKPPKGWGPLAAFPTLEDTLHFIHQIPLPTQFHLRIMKGTGTPATHTFTNTKLWLIDEGGKTRKATWIDIPHGTLFLDEFTPTELLPHKMQW